MRTFTSTSTSIKGRLEHLLRIVDGDIRINAIYVFFNTGVDMDVGRVIKQLRTAGARVEMSDLGVLVDGELVDFEFKTTGRLPERAWLQKIYAAHESLPDHTHLVVVAPRATVDATEWARAVRDMTLVLDDRVVHDGEIHILAVTPSAQPAKRGPRAYARYAVWRALLAGAPRNDQVRLAELAGATQGSVSNALRQLPDDADAAKLFDKLVANYPGPGGQSFYWWSDRPVDEQAKQLAARGALLSGDFAADAIAPWRVSERVVGYAREPIDLASDGYVLTDESDYTTLVTIPSDPTLWSTAAAWGKDGVVDPAIAAYDVLRTATTGDQYEAVDKLREYIVRWYAKHSDA